MVEASLSATDTQILCRRLDVLSWRGVGTCQAATAVLNVNPQHKPKFLVLGANYP